LSPSQISPFAELAVFPAPWRVLDDFLRFIIAWKLCSTMKAEDVTATLNLALKASGLDQAKVIHRPRLLSDNGSSYIGCMTSCARVVIAPLLGPRIGQGFGEASDRKIRRRCGIDDCGNDAGRQKGEGSQQADVPFALGFMLGNLSEGGKPAEPNALDPSSGLGDCGEQSIAPFGTHLRFCGGRMKDALNGHKA
jgi:hypothetical protein